MKDFLSWIDTSYTAGLIVLGLLVFVLILSFIGRRNVVKYAMNVESSDAKDLEIMRKVEYKDYSDKDEVDCSFESHLNL